MKKKRKWLRPVLIVVLLIAIVAGILFFPVAYHVERSIVIDVPAEQAFEPIQDFNQWTKWSPWLVMEPGAKVSVSGDGKSVGDVYSWVGELVGSGEIEHLAIEVPKSTAMEIRFKEPWASTAKVAFRVDAEGAGATNSRVTWMMDGKVPRVMKSMMAAWIGMDYDRGLRMMKDYIEDGSIVSASTANGVVERDAISYLGLTREFAFADIEAESGAAFDDLNKALATAGIATDLGFVEIYEEFELVDASVKMISAVVVSSAPETVPEGLAFGTMPAHKAFKVTHVGTTHHIGNGWSTGMQHLWMKKLKQSTEVMPYELYAADFASQADDAKTVEIFFPLK